MNSLTNLRVVLDSNVLISAAIWSGKPGLIIKKWRQGLCDLLVSPFILAELAKFLEEYGVVEEEREKIISEFNSKAIRIVPAKRVHICRDKKDNKILDLCLAGNADYLVTGDKDLLVLKSFKNTKIVTPQIFLRLKKLI